MAKGEARAGFITNTAGYANEPTILHSVALKYLPAASAQPRSVLLQALLNRVVIGEILAAKSLCISPARLLLLW